MIQMADYLQANTAYLLDREAWKFVRTTERAFPSYIDVPFQMWGLGDMTEHAIPNGLSRCVRSIKLNRLVLNFDPEADVLDIKFFNADKGVEESLGLKAVASIQTNIINGKSVSQVMQASYEVFTDYGVIKYVSDLSKLIADPNFLKIDGLYSKPLRGVCRDKFSCGLSQRKFNVVFNGRRLNGQSYAYVNGSWAVLLGDDFTFDSLAALNGTRDEVLGVDRFLYTVNPYIVKCSMLMR